MIRIAVLDDEKNYMEKVCSVTKEAMFHLNLAYEITCYEKVEAFINDLQNGTYFDIYLLDVEMPEMNGLTVAKNIRRQFSEPIIIYITNHVEYAIEAFEVNAYRYIPKQIIEEKLLEAYKVLLAKKTAVTEKVYVIKTINSVERIPYREIYYLKKEGKYVVFFHKRGRNRVRMTMEEVLEKIKSKEFLMIDRSYVVNLKYVNSFKQQQVILKDGSVLPVSKPRVQQVINEIVKFHEVE